MPGGTGDGHVEFGDPAGALVGQRFAAWARDGARRVVSIAQQLDADAAPALRRPRRIRSLDSLRGIAAFAVMLSHCMLTPVIGGSHADAIGNAARLAGKDAVLIFFVLSGFVLFLTFEPVDRLDYGPYIVKRFTRIYPPFLFAVLLSAGLYLLVEPAPIPSLSGWFNNENWSAPVDVRAVAGHLAMTDRPQWQWLDNVMWSLVHEIRISIVFPLLALCVLRSWRASLAVTFVLSAAATVAAGRLLPGAAFNPLSSLRYLFMFAGGAAMAFNRERLRHWFAQRSRAARFGCWAAALLLLVLPIHAIENATTP